MPKKKDEKDLTWEDIGKAIGKKVEKFDFERCPSWKKNFTLKYKEHGGGFGRLLFAVGLIYFLKFKGLLTGVPTWVIVLMAVGFTLMRI